MKGERGSDEKKVEHDVQRGKGILLGAALYVDALHRNYHRDNDRDYNSKFNNAVDIREAATDTVTGSIRESKRFSLRYIIYFLPLSERRITGG